MTGTTSPVAVIAARIGESGELTTWKLVTTIPLASITKPEAIVTS